MHTHPHILMYVCLCVCVHPPKWIFQHTSLPSKHENASSHASESCVLRSTNYCWGKYVWPECSHFSVSTCITLQGWWNLKPINNICSPTDLVFLGPFYPFIDVIKLIDSQLNCPFFSSFDLKLHLEAMISFSPLLHAWLNTDDGNRYRKRDTE